MTFFDGLFDRFFCLMRCPFFDGLLDRFWSNLNVCPLNVWALNWLTRIVQAGRTLLGNTLLITICLTTKCLTRIVGCWTTKCLTTKLAGGADAARQHAFDYYMLDH